MNQESARSIHESGVKGLSDEQVLEARKKSGWNEVVRKERPLLRFFRSFVEDPMLLLLVACSLLYFITGENTHGTFMLAAIVLVYSISSYQDSRTRKALSSLRSLTQLDANIIRNGTLVTLPVREIVVGDHVLVEEGSSIPADGNIVYSNDFSVNESILTGESFAVVKGGDNLKVFQGTNVATGLAIVEVSTIGSQTELEKVGKSIEDIDSSKTPLQEQIERFVRTITYAGSAVFVAIWIWNFRLSGKAIDALLKAVTIAMSIVPEEIPVAFTTFMAIGAWTLMRQGIIVRRTSTIETLGSASVICLDKTGTITENRMTLAGIYSFELNKTLEPDDQQAIKVITATMWASEPLPFDPMEVAIHEAYSRNTAVDERKNFKITHEYPLSGVPPMMTHVLTGPDRRVIAAKGALEALMAICNLSEERRRAIHESAAGFTSKGYRVLGVALSPFVGDDFPKLQQDLPFEFVGLVAFYDPPKKDIAKVFQNFYDAGIKVKVLTGDNELTALSIARQVGMRGLDRMLNGTQVLQMSQGELRNAVNEVNLYTRMFPDAKLKVLLALKENEEVVAMTGDGVNDGPALKAAHIGVAMGRKGSSVAKDVSAMILTDDNLSHLTNAIAAGRKIYSNLKKAIRYIISVHIPIILTVFIPLVLGWVFPNILSPVHVIFLEVIMGPTCSLVYENEPMEKGAMKQKPRPFTSTFFNARELGVSIVQGLVITIGCLMVYQFAVSLGLAEGQVRAMVFASLVSANVFLTLVNRSFTESLLTSFRYKNRLIPAVIAITIVLTIVIYAWFPLRNFFDLELVRTPQILIAISIGALSVLWFEFVKLFNAISSTKRKNI